MAKIIQVLGLQGQKETSFISSEMHRQYIDSIQQSCIQSGLVKDGGLAELFQPNEAEQPSEML